MLGFRSIKKTPKILQYAETECGLACLAILFQYYHRSVSLQTLRDFAGLSRDGTRASTLLSIARKAGFEADAYSLTIQALKTLDRPVILHWNFSHYVVLEGIKGNHVYINDPAMGRLVVTLDNLDQSFTGVAICLNPSQATTVFPRAVPPKPLRELFLSTWRLQWVLVFALILAGILPLVLSGLNAVFVNHVVIRHQLTWLNPIILLTAALSAVLLIFNTAQQWVMHHASARLGFEKSVVLFQRVLQWPARLYALRSKAELLTVLSQLNVSTTILLNGMSQLVSTMCVSILLMFGLWLLNHYLAIVSILLAFGVFWLAFMLSLKKSPADQAAANANAAWFAGSLSAFHHLETLALAGLQNMVFASWASLLYAKSSKQQAVNHWNALLSAVMKVYQATGPLIILILGAHQYENGHLSLGGLLAFSSLNALLNRQMMMALDALKSTKTTLAQWGRVNDVAAIETDHRFSRTSIQLNQMPCTLSVRGLSFFYNKTSEPILKNINFTVQPGQHIALVGGSGSGKSTLAKLLAGLLLPDEGSITWGGHAMSDLSPENLSACVAMVEQDANVFTGSLLENITLWQKHIPMEQVHDALHHVCMSSFIRERGLLLPLQYHANTISGGEKQRLVLAGALVQNTPLLILDEATSALDGDTEAEVMTHLKTLNKTIIHVAHRLSSIQHCDQIYVLAHGEIIEQGTHECLMQARGRYHDLLQCEVIKESSLASVA